GPGGGYYYYNFNFSLSGVPAPFNTGSGITGHYLKSNGGLAYLPGYNEVMTTAIDPVSRSFSNGILKNVNLGSDAGNMAARMELFASASNDPARNGKAAALGDLEILLDAASMEIGNRVWNDANANGIQDAHEVGIAGVQVVLRSPGADGVYGNGDDQTWAIITDANGNYYFDETVVNDTRRPSSWLGVSATSSGILPGFEYRIEIDKTQTALSSYRYLSGISSSANKSINSNGMLSGSSVRYVVNPGGSTAAGSVFENDYDVDFGFFAAVLSVQQLDLKAVLEKNITHLTWNTINETNVKQYHIERSIDGTNFTNIGSMYSKGAGNFSYAKDDNIASLSTGSVYYRLYIEDYNGQFKYSAIVKVGLNKNIKVAMMPNPFTSFINLQIDNNKREDAAIRIFNVTGQVVHKKSLILEKGINSILLDDMQRLPAGTYILDVRAGESSLTQKIVKR
ncbi:MAG: SdrD B-like domain-containing protein, partial [Chitinophagaceae bacterium]